MSDAQNFAAGPPVSPDREPGARSGSRARTVEPGSRSGSKARTVWSGVIVAAIVLILLLIFILQNTADVTIQFFGLSGELPISVALLFAAIAGVLLLAIPGTIRMLQLRKAARATGAAQEAPVSGPVDPSVAGGA